jgi:hypothetical protein
MGNKVIHFFIRTDKKDCKFPIFFERAYIPLYNRAAHSSGLLFKKVYCRKEVRG